jgi:hypothetical protein
MSKKLIAVAAAAALALTGLVGVAPASATPVIAYTTAGSAGGSGTAVDPYAVDVPHLNSLVAGTNALQIGISQLSAGDSATVTITGNAKVTKAAHAASTLVDVTTLGASTATTTLTSGTTANFFVYGTSTASASTIVISVTKTASGTTSTTTETKYFQPKVGVAHKVTNITVPATLANGASADVTFNITDVFGNVIESNSPAAAVSGAGTVAAGGVATWDATRKLNVARITSDNSGPFIVTIDGDAGDDDSGPANAGLGANTLNKNVAVVNNAGVSAQVATLTAELAAANAKLAKRVTKKRFNTLARKWNAAFPSQKVALKK